MSYIYEIYATPVLFILFCISGSATIFGPGPGPRPKCIKTKQTKHIYEQLPGFAIQYYVHMVFIFHFIFFNISRFPWILASACGRLLIYPIPHKEREFEGRSHPRTSGEG